MTFDPCFSVVRRNKRVDEVDQRRRFGFSRSSWGSSLLSVWIQTHFVLWVYVRSDLSSCGPPPPTGQPSSTSPADLQSSLVVDVRKAGDLGLTLPRTVFVLRGFTLGGGTGRRLLVQQSPPPLRCGHPVGPRAQTVRTLVCVCRQTGWGCEVSVSVSRSPGEKQPLSVNCGKIHKQQKSSFSLTSKSEEYLKDFVKNFWTLVSLKWSSCSLLVHKQNERAWRSSRSSSSRSKSSMMSWGDRVHGPTETSKWVRTVTHHLHHVLLLRNVMMGRIFQQQHVKLLQTDGGEAWIWDSGEASSSSD